MHAALRGALGKISKEVAAATRIIYGGENCVFGLFLFFGLLCLQLTSRSVCACERSPCRHRCVRILCASCVLQVP